MSGYTPIPQVTQSGQSNIGALFYASAQSNRQRIALVDGEKRYTYGELDERSNRLANYFLSKGLRSQDRVALLANNCSECYEVFLAAAKVGVIVAALNWRLGDRELNHCVSLVEPSLIITSEDLASNIDRIDAGAPSTLIIGGDYEAQLGASDAVFPDLHIDPEAGLVILYTSGTTGLPKGALISHRAMIARGLQFSSFLNIPDGDTFVAWTPLYHMVAVDQGLAHLLVGSTIYVVDGFQLPKLVEILQHHSMSWFVMVPGMVGLCIGHLKKLNIKPKGVGCIGAMADLIPRAEIAAATEFFDAPFVNSFGATETGLAPATGNYVAIGEAPERLPKRQSTFADIRLVDGSDNEVPVGTPGEVSIAGPTLFSGYWNNNEANESDFRGGRFHMGDVMRRNADGTLEYVDRVKYMIKSGGENIYPAEIESVMTLDERIETAIVVRKLDEKWGEIPVMFIVRRDESLTDTDILSLCEKELSRYKRPKEIYFISDDDIPRSTTGKIQRHELEARL
ncbi:class I adenylate-forming enzyme family protein [Aurantivibrio plasticivorans]